MIHVFDTCGRPRLVRWVCERVGFDEIPRPNSGLHLPRESVASGITDRPCRRVTGIPIASEHPSSPLQGGRSRIRWIRLSRPDTCVNQWIATGWVGVIYHETISGAASLHLMHSISMSAHRDVSSFLWNPGANRFALLVGPRFPGTMTSSESMRLGQVHWS